MTHVILVTGLLLQCLVGKTDRYHLKREDIEAIRMASGLHDIGKLQIPEEILTKPHSLTPEEYEIVKRQGRRHPHRGAGRVSRGRLRRAHERAVL